MWRIPSRTRVLPVLGLAFLASCGETFGPGDQLLGQWGTRSAAALANFTVRADSALLRFPCGGARFAGPLMLDAAGQFVVDGEAGGEGAIGPAQLAGIVDGSMLRLTLTSTIASPITVDVRHGATADFGSPLCLQ